jgi:hypothetical protein
VQNSKKWVKIFIWIVVVMMVMSFVIAIIPAIG